MDRKEMLARLEKGENPLELAIEKWQDIVEGKGEDLKTDNCALCELHNEGKSDSDDCINCPIYQVTGHRYCYNTPYYLYINSFGEKMLLKRAKEELEFLKSLRK